jgi:hypothetical protein
VLFCNSTEIGIFSLLLVLRNGNFIINGQLAQFLQKNIDAGFRGDGKIILWAYSGLT